MAYRGRMLLELITKLSNQVEQKVEDLHSDDLLVVEVRCYSVFTLRTLGSASIQMRMNWDNGTKECVVSHRNSCERGSTLCSLHSTRPLSSRMWMMLFSLKSVLVTMATSLTTPVCLWLPPLSSAGPCLTVRNHLLINI